MTKQEKRRFRELKRLYALKRKGQATMSLEELREFTRLCNLSAEKIQTVAMWFSFFALLLSVSTLVITLIF